MKFILFSLAAITPHFAFSSTDCNATDANFSIRCQAESINQGHGQPCLSTAYQSRETCSARFTACINMQRFMYRAACMPLGSPVQAPGYNINLRLQGSGAPPESEASLITIGATPVAKASAPAPAAAPPSPANAVRDALAGQGSTISGATRVNSSAMQDIDRVGRDFSRDFGTYVREPKAAITSAKSVLGTWEQDLVNRSLAPSHPEFTQLQHDKSLIERADAYITDPKKNSPLSEPDVRSANNLTVRRELLLVHDIKDKEPQVLNSARKLLEAASVLVKNKKILEKSGSSLESLRDLVAKTEHSSAEVESASDVSAAKKKEELSEREQGKTPETREAAEKASLRAALKKTIAGNRGKTTSGSDPDHDGQGQLTGASDLSEQGEEDVGGHRSSGEGLVASLSREAEKGFALAGSETDAEVRRLLSEELDQGGVLLAESESLFQRIRNAYRECQERGRL